MNSTSKIELRKPIIFFLVVMLSLIACNNDDDADPVASIVAPELKDATNIQATSFMASWNSVKNADTYLIEASEDPNFASFIEGFKKKSVKGTEVTVDGLEGETKYYFRVFAKDGTLESKPSSIDSVTTIKLIVAPDLEDPSEVTETSFGISWNAVSGADHYLIEVATEDDFSEKVTGYDKKKMEDIETTVEDLEANTTYYIRAYSVKKDDVSKPSASKEVTTNE